jgi:ring-1,2-phenylacetyl-CoA epoxidase subunit PaaD
VVTAADRPSLADRVWQELAQIADPEIPAISLVDLGVIGLVTVDAARARIEILPTFVGCPAVEVMRTEVRERIEALGVSDEVEVEISYRPPWTSDRISAAGRERLRLSGFAPPHPGPTIPDEAAGLDELAVMAIAECPYCGSLNTTLDNPFGPTLCRAIYHCANCRQPFEQMKRV